MLAAVDFNNPLIWAILIGWIMSVVLHEWAHGFAAHLGGDYTIKERGGLSLNPLQYIDPIFSLLLPAVFLLMGGVPLPGGVTYIRHDLLRSRGWQSAVAAAGPLMNLILFLLLALPFHPRVGLIDPTVGVERYETWQIFLGTMVLLQGIAVAINLIPVPPLDGFNIIAPYMKEEARIRLTTPPISTYSIIALFLILWNVPGVFEQIILLIVRFLLRLGIDPQAVKMMLTCYDLTFFGRKVD
jgi:Zn-dependent protease